MKRKWAKTESGIVVPKLPWFIVGRVPLGKSVDRLYYWSGRIRRFVDLSEKATKYRSQSQAESRMLVLAAKNPKWIGKLEVTQETVVQSVGLKDFAHEEFEYEVRRIK